MSIEIQGLTKCFGHKKAVNSLTLRIEGGMYGLLGPNGAGKTTLMRMLCTLLTPTNGTALMDGISIQNRTEVRRVIGYLPQDFSFYPNFTPVETLDYLGMLSGMKDRKQRFARIEELLALTNLGHHRKKRLRQLSGGERRRLGIAQMLLADPQILIVDEPTAGLDPEERIRFRNLLSTLAAGKTVLLSTHIAEDITQTCPNVAVLSQGGLLYAGSVHSLTERAAGYVWEANVDTQAFASLEKEASVLSVVTQADGFTVRVLSQTMPCGQARPVAPSLEDAYMLLTKGVRTA